MVHDLFGPNPKMMDRKKKMPISTPSHLGYWRYCHINMEEESHPAAEVTVERRSECGIPNLPQAQKSTQNQACICPEMRR